MAVGNQSDRHVGDEDSVGLCGHRSVATPVCQWIAPGKGCRIAGSVVCNGRGHRIEIGTGAAAFLSRRLEKDTSLSRRIYGFQLLSAN